MERIPICSFFSGAGFLDLGFYLSEYDIIFTNEISEQISKIYESGMSSCLKKDVQIDCHDSIETLTAEKIKEIVIKRKKDKFWGIIGGPPCPDFSVGGKNKGHQGDKGRLTEVFIELICKTKPDFFVVENVKGLIKTQKHRVFFDSMVEKLEDNGYAVDFKVLNALELGVPQDRERIFIIGVKRKIFSAIFKKEYRKDRGWFYWPYYEKYKNAKDNYSWPTVNKFGENVPKPTEIPEELMVGTYILDDGSINNLPNSNEFFSPKSEKFVLIDEGDDRRKSFKRLHRWRFSPTVAYGNNEVHLHPIYARRLSVREALRLQSVPDSYIISEDIPLTAKFKAIGNGVPVKMANLLASNLNCFLKQYLYNQRG